MLQAFIFLLLLLDYSSIRICCQLFVGRLSLPGYNIADTVQNLFEQDNLSLGEQQSQVVGGNWPLLNSNAWVGNQSQNGMPPKFNLKNYIVQSPGIYKVGACFISIHFTSVNFLLPGGFSFLLCHNWAC